MAWSYDCSGAFDGTGNFIVDISGSKSESGPNELGSSGSGTDYYYDSGTFNAQIISECTWSITVNGNGSGPLGTPATFTSGQIGDTGSSPQFDATGPWTMAWTYNCAGNLDGTGNFIVDIQGPGFDIGPNELGAGASGTDTYTDSGIFNLEILSECNWSITVQGSPPPPSSPPPPPSNPPAPTCPATAGPPLGSATAIAALSLGGCPGYLVTDSHGDISAFGSAPNYGSLSGLALNAPIISITATTDGQGYWLLGADGGVYSFGDASFYGSMGGQHLNAPIVSIATTSDGHGYWLIAKDGGVFSFGDATFHGSTGSLTLNQPVDGIAVGPRGNGYWLVASDGGVFSFSEPFVGSLGSTPLNKPIIGMSSDAAGTGYTLVGSDGGVFSFGAPFYGSLGANPPATPVVGLATTPGGGGYYLVDGGGDVFAFGAARSFGGVA